MRNIHKTYSLHFLHFKNFFQTCLEHELEFYVLKREILIKIKMTVPYIYCCVPGSPCLRADATKPQHSLSPVAQYKNSTHHFVYLTGWRLLTCVRPSPPIYGLKGNGPCLVAARSQDSSSETLPRWHATIFFI